MKKIMDFIYHYIKPLHTALMKNDFYFRLRHIYWEYGGIVQMYDCWMREKAYISKNYTYNPKKLELKEE